MVAVELGDSQTGTRWTVTPAGSPIELGLPRFGRKARGSLREHGPRYGGTAHGGCSHHFSNGRRAGGTLPCGAFRQTLDGIYSKFNWFLCCPVRLLTHTRVTPNWVTMGGLQGNCRRAPVRTRILSELRRWRLHSSCQDFSTRWTVCWRLKFTESAFELVRGWSTMPPTCSSVLRNNCRFIASAVPASRSTVWRCLRMSAFIHCDRLAT